MHLEFQHREANDAKRIAHKSGNRSRIVGDNNIEEGGDDCCEPPGRDAETEVGGDSKEQNVECYGIGGEIVGLG